MAKVLGTIKVNGQVYEYYNTYSYGPGTQPHTWQFHGGIYLVKHCNKFYLEGGPYGSGQFRCEATIERMSP
jgi:hypothetical protein